MLWWPQHVTHMEIGGIEAQGHDFFFEGQLDLQGGALNIQFVNGFLHRNLSMPIS